MARVGGAAERWPRTLCNADAACVFDCAASRFAVAPLTTGAASSTDSAFLHLATIWDAITPAASLIVTSADAASIDFGLSWKLEFVCCDSHLESRQFAVMARGWLVHVF